MVTTPKTINCFNCGEFLCVGVAWPGDIEACGSAECQRAMREELQARDAQAREQAAEDNYDRYR